MKKYIISYGVNLKTKFTDSEKARDLLEEKILKALGNEIYNNNDFYISTEIIGEFACVDCSLSEKHYKIFKKNTKIETLSHDNFYYSDIEYTRNLLELQKNGQYEFIQEI